MKKENIKKNIAAIALVATLVTGGTSIAVEANVDHIHEYCPFCNVLGMKHQADAINSYKKYADYVAEYPGYTLLSPKATKTSTQTIDATKHVDENGLVTYTAPAGYTLQGDKAFRTTITTIDATKRVNENGEITYTAPAGYTLQGITGIILTKNNESDECVRISKRK